MSNLVRFNLSKLIKIDEVDVKVNAIQSLNNDEQTLSGSDSDVPFTSSRDLDASVTPAQKLLYDYIDSHFYSRVKVLKVVAFSKYATSNCMEYE